MGNDLAIKVENIGKCYRINHQHQSPGRRYKALRDVISESFKKFLPGQKAKNSLCSARQTKEDFWALKDISFEIKNGEAVGIIGRNGAGKSTLLKVLSRITEPTKGSIGINGRVASLLEVGTGFHPELTGRENIYLNGAILGMKRIEIQAKFHEIVEFAEVEKFLDTPVKRYSSGMYVRLAFAVAAHLDPEVLIIDEVLAVGDAAFQKKCLGKMSDVASNGRTVIFVSHNMAVVAQLCDRAILLENGEITQIGAAGKTISGYLGKDGSSSRLTLIEASQHSNSWGGSSKIQLCSVKLLDTPYSSFTVHWKQDITFEIEFIVKERNNNTYFGLGLTSNQGTDIFGAHNDDDGSELYNFEPGIYSLVVTLKNPLRAGIYFISLGASTAIGGSPIFRVANAVCVEVLDISIDGTKYPQYESGPINGIAAWSKPRLKTSGDQR